MSFRDVYEAMNKCLREQVQVQQEGKMPKAISKDLLAFAQKQLVQHYGEQVREMLNAVSELQDVPGIRGEVFWETIVQPQLQKIIQEKIAAARVINDKFNPTMDFVRRYFKRQKQRMDYMLPLKGDFLEIHRLELAKNILFMGEALDELRKAFSLLNNTEILPKDECTWANIARQLPHQLGNITELNLGISDRVRMEWGQYIAQRKTIRAMLSAKRPTEEEMTTINTLHADAKKLLAAYPLSASQQETLGKRNFL